MAATIHLDAANPVDIQTAAELLRAGKLVAFATETVYGLGANALSAEAVGSIFIAKRRPSWDPLIVHLASVERLGSITEIAGDLKDRVSGLAAAFWPGPLTLLLPRSTAVPDAVTAGRELVGVRVPSHPAAQALLRATGLPIAAPSANLFGHTSPTTAAHVIADLDGRIDAVLDAGPTDLGVESTVLDPTQTPMVLYRPGAISAEQIRAVTGVAVTVFQPVASARPEAMPSPGVGIRHYAPRARLVLVEPALSGGVTHALLRVAAMQPSDGQKMGVMLPDGWVAPPASTIFRWGAWDDSSELANRLFAGLRHLDDHGVDCILCPVPPAGVMAEAIRDRLEKAARPV